MRFRILALMAALLASPAVFAQALVDQAIAHLKNNARIHGVEGVDFSHVVATDAYTSRGTQMTHVYLRQQWAGIDVVEANYSVSLYPGGGLIHAAGAFVPGLAHLGLATAPALSAADAADALATHAGLTPTAPFSVVSQEGGAARAVTLAEAGVALEPIPARLVYQWNDERALRLAWEVGIYQRDAQHYWQGYVDALSGEVLRVRDLVDHDTWGEAAPAAEGPTAAAVPVQALAPLAPARRTHEGPVALGVETYRVVALPFESPNHTGAPPPADGRTLEVTPADPTASPFGWHDTNGVAGPEFTVTRGNNVSAYQDQDTDGTPEAGEQPDGGADLIFDFPINFAADPISYRDAAVTNLFYWNNILHDVFYLYGFDEPAGNFQVNNYGNGGQGNDDVRAEAQDGGGINNANFFTPPDGSRPRMQMYLWATSTPRKDGDLDNGIIAHEWGHGLAKRLVGGPGNASCLSNNEQMGEGISDLVGLLTTMEASDTGADRRGIATYSLSQTILGTGLRPAAYSTNFAINNYTYQRSRTQAVPHGVGFVWATVFWEAAWEVIDVHGFDPDIYNASGTAGNQVMLQLLVDALKLMPCSSGFVDARDAILAADATRYGGAHTDLLWAAFARRGLGAYAFQGSPDSNSDNTEDFSLPTDPPPVAAIDPQSFMFSVPRFETEQATMTIENTGAVNLVWSVDATPSWLSLSQTSGTVAPGASVDVTLTASAGGLPVNTYNASIAMYTNDPNARTLNIPVQLEVVPPIANEGGLEFPGTHLLSEVYPNPFNPQATFSLAVAEAQAVRIELYDALGRRVALLHEGALSGRTRHTFTVDGSQLTSGTYFVRIAGEAFAEMRRITLLK